MALGVNILSASILFLLVVSGANFCLAAESDAVLLVGEDNWRSILKGEWMLHFVMNGEFRQYPGPRDKDDLIDFIEREKWTILEPLPKWRYPDSTQISMKVRDLHYYLVEEKHLPPIVSYAMFTGVTLFVGCILGYLIVCLIDMVFPTEPPPARQKQDKNKKLAPFQKAKLKQKNGTTVPEVATTGAGDNNDVRQRGNKKKK